MADEPFTWLLVFVAAHFSLIALAGLVLHRVRIYTRTQTLLQLLITMLLPLVGVTVVIVMAWDALSEPPKPDSSRFDRNHIGSGD